MTEKQATSQTPPSSKSSSEAKKPTEKLVRIQKTPKKQLVDLTRKRKVGVLRFAPKAWAKLLWFRDRGPTEIAGFGVSRANDPLYVEEFVTIPQEADVATFEFEDDATNDYLTDMVKAGHQPAECFRIWLHSHPGSGKGFGPSGHDEEVFERCFGGCDWSIMFIINGSDTYARLRLSASKGQIAMSCKLDVERDYSGEFRGVTEKDIEAWENEYVRNISVCNWVNAAAVGVSDNFWREYSGFGEGADLADDRRVDEHFLTPVEDVRDDATVLDTVLGTDEILSIDNVDSTRKIVYTSEFWAIYPLTAQLKVDKGEFIEKFRDLSDEPPEQWGELTWGGEEGADPIVTSIYTAGQLVQVDAGLELAPSPEPLTQLESP